MKRIAIITAVLLLQTTIAVSADDNKVDYNYYYHNNGKSEQAQVTPQKVSEKTTAKPTVGDSDYLLKYNIDDLEAAPWVNGGKRKL